MHPINSAFPGSAFNFGFSRKSRVYGQTATMSEPLQLKWPGLGYLGRCMSSRQACRLASLASLAEVCLSQPVRRQTMRIFSQFACGLSMELSACSGKVSAPKTERAHAGQLQRRGGSLTAPRAVLHSRSVCLEKFCQA
jgi:hypothetical protein